MKMKYWFLLLIIPWACKDKYVANIHVPPLGFLVVEGFINVGNGSTNIQLSRASSLDSPVIIWENGADLAVQSENGASYSLNQDSAGHYSIGQLPVDLTQKYRLYIRTTNGKEYLSEFSEAKISPPIDSVNWTANQEQVTIYVSTHDDQNKTLYYQWQFEETWKYTSAYGSDIEYKGGQIVIRPDSDMVHICWRSDVSTTIAIASSAKLSSDVIYQFPLTLVPYNSTDKLINRYSILVKQFALTKDWYEWKLKVKKNTEQLGTIFDAQPSTTGGNITCTTDPTESVVGFIGCTSETEKRIFIDRSEIPPTPVFSGYEYCQSDTVPLSDVDATYSSGFYLPTQQYYLNGFLVGIIGAGAACVDCRFKGGTLIQPPFWQ
jgi:hypothetical protein